MKKAFSKTIAGFLCFFVAACASNAQTADLVPITVQLGTTHQAVYAGFYAADLNGDYAREGLAVRFIEGGNDIDQVATLLDGTAQFSIIGASGVISARAAGKPVRAVATVLRRDPVVFFSLADSGIVRLEDFVGKKVLATQIIRPRLFAMLAKAGINRDQINLESAGSFTDLYTGKIDVASGLITSSVLAAEKAGHPVNIIYPDNYGVHFYSTTIDSTDDYIASSPELITRFLRATFQGWVYTVENPQAVGAMVVHYNPKADADFETASMIASLAYVILGKIISDG